MLALIPSWLKIGLSASLAALLVAWLAYTLGTSHGRQQAAVDALKETVEAYRTRQEIDNEVDRSDLLVICVELGGLRDECAEQLRGLDEATGSE